MDALWPMVTAVGVVAGAALTLFFGMWNLIHTRRRDLPVVSASVHRQPQGLPHKIDFTLETEPKWLVMGACVRGEHRSCLAVAAEPLRDTQYGGIVGWRATGPWQRRVTFDPPVLRGWVLLDR